jgi:type I restriction enzyme R subunit
MVVCIDKKTTVKMYQKVNAEIEKLKLFLENKLSLASSTMEIKEIQQVIQKLEDFDSAVVVSFGSTQNEEQLLKEEGIDMKPHRKRMLDQDLEKEFKKDNNFKMVFVCNMRLTGFDAPKVRTLYLDKPMK